MQSKIPKQIFITATDTNAGKTMVTQLLIQKFQERGFSAIGCKPVACGVTEENHYNEDVLLYQKINSLPLSREQINPVHFELPISPHLAALAAEKEISVKDVTAKLKELQTLPIDYIFYEGIGGWKVPLNKNESMIDLALSLECTIIFVVGIRVGCMNHALLTWEAMNKVSANVIGWIANIIDPDTPAIPSHILSLEQYISAPYLGTVPYSRNNQPINNYLNIELIKTICHSNTN